MIINIDGLDINYEVNGEGENILCLHGWGGEIDSFRPVINYFSQQYKVYAIDFPGFGKSQLSEQVWGVEEYTELVKNFIDKMNLQKVNIIAHSFGGRVSIMLSAKYPELVNKMILADSAGLIEKRTLKYYYKVYSFKLLNKLYLLFTPKKDEEKRLEKFYLKFGSSDYRESGNLRKNFVKVVNQDLIDYLPKIKASTLLIWGEEDKATPVSFGKIMEKKIPDAGLIVFKDAGHFSYLDKLGDFCVIAMNFLNNK